LKLLLDHSLSPRIARALAALFDQHEIVALRERFREGAPDAEWISSLDRGGGWAVLTTDLRLRNRPEERAVLDRTAILFFFLTAAWRRFSVTETAARLILLMPKMADQMALAERGRFDLPVNAASRLRAHRN
jgi:hypothetical protein